jgi:hypothetical protein
MMDEQRIKLILDMGASGANVEQVKRKLEELETSLEKTGNKMAGVGQTALQSGRFLQDFAQGGVGGVLNNIEGLAMALGGGPGLAGVLTAVGLAAFFAMPKIKEFFGGMTEATDAVKKLNEQIKEQEERIKKAHEAFEKLAHAPESIEAESAKKLQEFLAERPHGEEAKQAVAGGLDVTQARAALSQPQQQAMAQAEAQLFAAEAYKRDPSIIPLIGGQAFTAQRQAEAGAARAQIALLMQQGRQQGADAVLQQAQVAGPLGDAARARVFAAAQGRPGLAGLAETTPDAIEERRERRRLTEIDNKQAERMANLGAEAFEKRVKKGEQLQAAGQENEEQTRREQQQEAKDDTRKRLEQNRQEQRRIEAADQRNRQFEAIRQRNAQRAPVAQMEQATTQLSQNLGYGTPNAAEANEMADAALRNINNGVNVQQATWMAVMQKMQAIRAATAQANEQWGKMQNQTQNGLGN